MVLKRVLTEVISQATETSQRRTPFELFDLGEMSRESVREEVTARSRVREDITPEEVRAKRMPVVSSRPEAAHVKKLAHSDVVPSLRSADGLRRALVLREILGPPRSIRDWEDPQ